VRGNKKYRKEGVGALPRSTCIEGKEARGTVKKKGLLRRVPKESDRQQDFLKKRGPSPRTRRSLVY